MRQQFVIEWSCHYPDCKVVLDDDHFNKNRKYCDFHKKKRALERIEQQNKYRKHHNRFCVRSNCIVCGEKLPPNQKKFCSHACEVWVKEFRRDGGLLV